MFRQNNSPSISEKNELEATEVSSEFCSEVDQRYRENLSKPINSQSSQRSRVRNRNVVVRAVLVCLLALFICLLFYFQISLTLIAAITVLILGITSLLATLASNFFSLFFVYLYRKHSGPDAKPSASFASTELPVVTIQLPVYNEANVVERLLRFAAEVDYPHDRLQIQLLDDSNDETTDIVLRTFDDLRFKYPAIDYQYLKRPNRDGWKAGSLNYGLARASGEFVAIFDADFIIPKNFLQRTIHFFTDENVALVQGRWDYTNRRYSTLTATQASKLDAHQMFEQTARYRSGRWIHFHGTAGVWRTSAIEDAGGWSAATDVEDADLSIRALLKDWDFIYLNDLKVLSELPSTMGAYLVQQRRWKRGWTKIFQMYAGKVAFSRAPFWVRIDLMQRLINMFSTLFSLVVSMGALPIFMASQRLGVAWLVYGLYTSLFFASLALRLYEGSTAAEAEAEAPNARKSQGGLLQWFKRQIPYRFMLDMGTLWAWTVGTFEAWAGKSAFERTPKMSISDADAAKPGKPAVKVKRQRSYGSPAYRLGLGTLFLGTLTIACIHYAVVTEHWFSIFFYTLQLAGSAWVCFAVLVRE